MDASNNHPKGGKVSVKFNLAAYLKRLEAGALEGDPRPVPTIKELAKVAGISRVSMSNLANGNRESVNTETLGAVMGELKRRGFDVEIQHLFSVEVIP